MFFSAGLLLASAAQGQDSNAASAASLTEVSYKGNASYDNAAERRIFDLANEDRERAGLTPLKWDEGLNAAARRHSAMMASQRQLSHQLNGEPDLAQRLGSLSSISFSSAGENVGIAPTPDDSQRSFMHSPHHRENLLDASFNYAGFGVVRIGHELYVTQDFAEAQPKRQVGDVARTIVESFGRARAESGLGHLRTLDGREAEAAACSMAKADSLHVETPPAHYELRFTTSRPEVFPKGMEKALRDASLETLAAGTCFGRTPTYPGGTYWVVLLLD